MNSFGNIFRVSIFGESHNKGCGIVVDGCPAGIPINEDDLLIELARRKSGAKGTTPREEEDMPEIFTGTFNGFTTGAPITIIFRNANTRSRDYSRFLEIPRPGHSDFVAKNKYGGYTDYRGGGHFSGRITLGLVSAGAIAKKIIAPMNVKATILEVGGSKNIDEAVDKALAEKDSIGGIIECATTNMPIGLGDPFFDSAESNIAHIMFAVPAIKGIEFGAGFASAKMKGSEHNDWFVDTLGATRSNNNGGINGGITNGNNLVFRVVVKPTSSTYAKQETMNFTTGKIEDFEVEGRHDTCIPLRIPVIIESATAIALADMALIDQQIPRVFNKK